MARADRLFRLLTALRSLPRPVTALRLAEETGVSPRTLYRDIDALRAGGALIDGAPGYGYTLAEDPALPPQMLTRLEVEALALGLAEIRLAGDPALARAADTALAKIVATLPDRVQAQALHTAHQVYRFEARPPAPAHMALLREAIWAERAVDIAYADRGGRGDPPADLAAVHRLPRPQPDVPRLLLPAPGLPALPPRPDVRRHPGGGVLPPPPGGAPAGDAGGDEGAEAGRRRRAVTTAADRSRP